jgi:hypothetical protein
LLFGDWGSTEVKVFLTSLCVTAASILTMCGAVAWERGRLGPVPPAGAVASLLGFGLLVIGMWGEIDNEEFWKSAVTGVIAGITGAHFSLLALASLQQRFELWRRMTFGFGLLLAGFLTVGMWGEIDNDAYWRAVGILSILVAAGTIAVPVLHRLSGIRPETALRHCPNCGASLAASPCPRCGARFSVEFLQP